jgi:hypothetical protein
MSRALIVPAATPYAEALLLSNEKNIENDMIKIVNFIE